MKHRIRWENKNFGDIGTLTSFRRIKPASQWPLPGVLLVGVQRKKKKNRSENRRVGLVLGVRARSDLRGGGGNWGAVTFLPEKFTQ